jgi:hypothetical protein
MKIEKKKDKGTQGSDRPARGKAKPRRATRRKSDQGKEEVSIGGAKGVDKARVKCGRLRQCPRNPI